MAASDSVPGMQPFQTGAEWYVLVTWPEGQTDRIDGFTSQRAAELWIEREIHSWEVMRRARFEISN
jgi:hypothetical protein